MSRVYLERRPRRRLPAPSIAALLALLLAICAFFGAPLSWGGQ